MSPRARRPEPGFEPSLQRLEEIAARLESDELELAEALALYEEGVRLARSAEAVLNRAAARVEELAAGDERPHPAPPADDA